MDELALGTKEYLLVDVEDRLGAITTLDGLTLKYDVKTHGGTSKIAQGTALNTGMVAECLIDTTNWSADEYDLWLDVTIGAEKPRLGPFHFVVR